MSHSERRGHRRFAVVFDDLGERRLAREGLTRRLHWVFEPSAQTRRTNQILVGRRKSLRGIFASGIFEGRFAWRSLDRHAFLRLDGLR